MTRNTWRHGALATAALALVLVVSGALRDQQPWAASPSAMQSAPAPAAIITAAQAAAGQSAYQARRASCHLADLGGRGEASPLAGPSFMTVWRMRSTTELYDYIRTSMPPGGATLGADEYLSITAFILRTNGAAAGAVALAPTTNVPIGTIATGIAPTTTAQTAAPAAGGAARPAGPPPARGHYVTGEVPRFTPVTDAMLRTPPAGDWLMARRTYQAWSHSPLDEITPANVGALRLAWVSASLASYGSSTAPPARSSICARPCSRTSTATSTRRG